MSKPENFEELCDILRRLAKSFGDMNSQFQATQEFLRKKGLTNVNQLDKNGRKELAGHLSRVLLELGN